MVKSVGLYKLKDVSKREEVLAIFEEFANNIPEIKRSEMGKDILAIEGVTYDMTVMNTFESVEAFTKFREHPLHLEKGPFIREQCADIKLVMIDLDEAVEVGV